MADALVGSWRLVAFELRLSGGGVVEPLGPSPTGTLLYTPEGRMAVNIMAAEREPFAVPDPLRGTPDEAKAAFERYLGYAGTYAVDEADSRVDHHLDVSWFPNWTGTVQQRSYALDGDRLTLTAPPIPVGGQDAVGVLVWERLS